MICIKAGEKSEAPRRRGEPVASQTQLAVPLDQFSAKPGMIRKSGYRLSGKIMLN